MKELKSLFPDTDREHYFTLKAYVVGVLLGVVLGFLIGLGSNA